MNRQSQGKMWKNSDTGMLEKKALLLSNLSFFYDEDTVEPLERVAEKASIKYIDRSTAQRDL